jgi:hypothetical protein
MGKKKMMAIMMSIVGIMFFASMSFAGGYPFGIIDTGSSTKIIVVGKFSAGFTQQEAQNASAAVISLVNSNLGSSTTGTSFFTPNDFKSMGIEDADLLKSAVKSVYQSWGFGLYVFIEVKRVGEYAPGFGNNVRVDAYIADMAVPLGISSDYLYLLSIETSEFLLTQANP